MGRNVVVVVALALTAGCELTCPIATAFEHEPFSVGVAGTYVQDGLSEVLYLPAHIPSFEYDFASERWAGIVVCESDGRGVPVFAPSGVPACPSPWNTYTGAPASADCVIDPIDYNFSGVTGASTSVAAHVIERVETVESGLLVTIRCDLSRGGDNGGADISLTLQGTDYTSEYTLVCKRATSVSYYFDGTATDPMNRGPIHVGEEFYVRVGMYDDDLRLNALDGRGHRALDSDPPFEIVRYEAGPNQARRLRLRALRPASQPVMVAGTGQAPLPIEIIP